VQDNGASRLELEGRDTKQLGSLAREGGQVLDKVEKIVQIFLKASFAIKQRQETYTGDHVF